MSAATRIRGCAVVSVPARPVPTWQSRLRARRSAKRFPSYGTPDGFFIAYHLQRMHDRVTENMFRKDLAEYGTPEYERLRRAVLRQEAAFSRLLAALVSR
jgi:hypothetical protein